MSLGKLIGKGSAKDIYEVPGSPEHLAMRFSDRVSVFDYGALPDEIPGKGAAQERSARAFCRILEKAGLRTAWDEALSQKTGAFVLQRAQHPKFSPAPAKLQFIPLEVIFRWGVVPGSSLLKREPQLKSYERWSVPRVEFTTKLESRDRLLNENEARQLAGSDHIYESLVDYTQRLAFALQEALVFCDVELWDGKIECAWDAERREIVMVDALTPDELRATVSESRAVPLSKELLRQWLGPTAWAFQIAEAKRRLPESEWKKQLPKPPRLGAWRVGALGGLYTAFAEALERSSGAPLRAWLSEEKLAKPKVHVIGSGGREDALRWRLRLEGCDVVDSGADAVWVSPDAELARGDVDKLLAEQTWAFGPVQAAAKLEWSKAYGRHIAGRAGITQPKHSSDPADLRSFSNPPVVKEDGLAAGKGVVVPESWEEAERALAKAKAKGPVLLEQRLRGFEASAFFGVRSGFQGLTVSFLGTARDFKRRFNFDEGPNTGGMGAYAPHPQLGPDDIALFTQWARRTAEELAKDGIPFNGVLYLGLMRDSASTSGPTRGWHLIEYNARFGDPETQALVMLWPSDQRLLRPLLGLDLQGENSLEEDLEDQTLCLALVRPNYPESSPPIDLPAWQPSNENLQLFRAASTGGRVGYLVGRGQTLLKAGDPIFAALIDSPWKAILEWRTDILP